MLFPKAQATLYTRKVPPELKKETVNSAERKLFKIFVRRQCISERHQIALELY